jgi:hypothetical protein
MSHLTYGGVEAGKLRHATRRRLTRAGILQHVQPAPQAVSANGFQRCLPQTADRVPAAGVSGSGRPSEHRGTNPAHSSCAPGARHGTPRTGTRSENGDVERLSPLLSTTSASRRATSGRGARDNPADVRALHDAANDETAFTQLALGRLGREPLLSQAQDPLRTAKSS